jgi:hypothetical protein
LKLSLETEKKLKYKIQFQDNNDISIQNIHSIYSNNLEEFKLSILKIFAKRIIDFLILEKMFQEIIGKKWALFTINENFKK